MSQKLGSRKQRESLQREGYEAYKRTGKRLSPYTGLKLIYWLRGFDKAAKEPTDGR